MLKQDFIMRAIQRVVDGLMRLAGLIEAGKEQEALEVLDGALRDLLGLGSLATAGMSDRALMELLEERGGEIDVQTRTLLLAALLREEARLHLQAGRHRDGLGRLLKSLQIALCAPTRSHQQAWPQWAPPIEALADALSSAGVVLPARTGLALAEHRLERGDLAAAEDAVFQALENPTARAEHVAPARALYERMLALDDEALEAGGLPRDEVRASLEEIGHLEAGLRS